MKQGEMGRQIFCYILVLTSVTQILPAQIFAKLMTSQIKNGALLEKFVTLSRSGFSLVREILDVTFENTMKMQTGLISCP